MIDEIKSYKIGKKVHAEKKLSKKQVEVKIDTKSLYVVKKGDTLYSISKKLDISVSELIKLNKIKNNNLSVGQSLKIINK